MVIDMKENLIMMLKKDMEFIILNLELHGKDLFMMIKWMEKEFLKGNILGKLLMLKGF